ncbi:hypothetical protein M406DRAFT_295379 [Cryphonectria parasitica EP155]|uniref:Endosomal peripheral membrane protein n=1 Tax=Cryphonectria parasitica (strain ATCC 38755 / EP155) TaxID=660469 RepID=A0A9P4XVI5_CRYP1|nr:uncharacterized protein M406DRAFT_295379 [Cryphonectria parasitica EP155]KAF3761693.1 hypothetical protein M406DRAFT_295379 [Cryphonectria parasitica EP155]
MSAQLLVTELNNLITESKRKHQDLRQAAEKSLEELKGLRVTEAQLGAELSQRVNFANPFIIACGTKNAKFTSIAIVCLQRLIVSKALPRSKLSPVLEALREATSAGLDVQLKILQALPSLLQNYSIDIKSNLLVTALNICFILQSSKNAIVNNTSAATLQQLIVSVFEKVVAEDKLPDAPFAGEAPAHDGKVQLRAAALDAYRIFNDLCLLTQAQRPEYLRFSGLQQTFGLELIESALTNHAGIFATHPEQVHILRTKVMPFIIKTLSGRPHFASSVRLFRILYTLLRRHIALLPKESGEALEILTQILDQDTALWKRSLCMEVFRGIFAEPALIRRIFRTFDAKEGGKTILKNLTATFVRVSTEKPVVIGLAHQSTIPVANPYSTSADQAVLDASGVSVSVIAGSVGGNAHDTGISTQWSSMRVPCIDQLDKTDPPPIPESYVYSLTLACITSLSEGLAKFVLPLTVPGDRGRRRGRPGSSADASEERPDTPSSLERSASFKKNPVPVNPLTLKEHPLFPEIETCAAIIDECWPAILATCSTFLYAALDSEYYHGLVRAFQRFAHVAGLLQLSTPRDAFLTTLGKAAVPANVFTACLNAGQPRQSSTVQPSESTGNSILGNARGLLSVENLVSQSNAAEKSRSQSFDASSTALNTRNLLCLRALLNLGIALGPTLSASWQIILETLQQADFVLFTTGKTAGRTPIAAKGPDPNADKEASALLANFSTEIKSVETAASRLFESTIDFPNGAFLEVVNAVCGLLEKRSKPDQNATERDGRPETIPEESSSQPQSPTYRRMPATLSSSGPVQADQFALAKLGDLASINLERLLVNPPDVSGWEPLISELNLALSSAYPSAPVRTRAADILVRLILEAANATASLAGDIRGQVQLRLLEAFRDALLPMQAEDRERSVASHSTDIEIHRVVLEGLKSILENCGESLVSGWDLTFEIIDSIFVDKLPTTGGAESKSTLTTRSTKLIKASFGSLQLICSDFLSSLPNLCFLNLVDTLYKFCSQDDDLNVALTTVTFFWAISDFLSEKSSNSMSITEEMIGGARDEALIELASHPDQDGSSAALWMLLLLRLTAVTTDQRLELRNSAIHTLLRIIHAYGNNLGPQAWSISVKYVIFKLLSSIEDRLRIVRDEGVEGDIRAEWNETAVVVVQGVSSLLASYLDILTAYPAFTALWQDLIGHFATMLDFQALDINSATFSSLGGILSKCEEGGKSSFDKKTIDLVWDLWSRRIPVAGPSENGKHEDSQRCLISWVEAFLELYRLIQAELSIDRVKRLLELLHEAMLEATPGSYASDIEYATPLQGRILEVVKLVRTDISGVPSAIISQVSEFVLLAFDQERGATSPTSKRTYIAMAKESMGILQYHVLSNATDVDIYVSGAFSKALTAIAKPIVLKYDFPVVTKSEQLWKVATTSVLAVLESTLPQVKAAKISRATVQEIWDVVMSISNGIITANYENASTGTNIVSDQEFDIAAFRSLKELIIPSLGSELIPDKTRKGFAEGLFRTSIIHTPAPAEADIIYGNDSESIDDLHQALGTLCKPRGGRTIDPQPTKRKEMSYVCLDELFDLVTAHDEKAAGPDIKDTDQTNSTGETTHALHVRLALTAAPYLVLRCALTLRAYVADQPLRGRMPQPLSQRRELERVLRCLINLHSEPEAIPGVRVHNGDKPSARHLYGLYPLLVRAVMVNVNNGDERIVGLVAQALSVVGKELGLDAGVV